MCLLLKGELHCFLCRASLDKLFRGHTPQKWSLNGTKALWALLCILCSFIFPLLLQLGRFCANLSYSAKPDIAEQKKSAMRTCKSDSGPKTPPQTLLEKQPFLSSPKEVASRSYSVYLIWNIHLVNVKYNGRTALTKYLSENMTLKWILKDSAYLTPGENDFQSCALYLKMTPCWLLRENKLFTKWFTLIMRY